MIHCPHADWVCLLSAELNHRWAISTVWPSLQEAEERRVDYLLSLTLYFLMELRMTFLSGSLPVFCNLRRWCIGEIGQTQIYSVKVTILSSKENWESKSNITLNSKRVFFFQVKVIWQPFYRWPVKLTWLHHFTHLEGSQACAGYQQMPGWPIEFTTLSCFSPFLPVCPWTDQHS